MNSRNWPPNCSFHILKIQGWCWHLIQLRNVSGLRYWCLCFLQVLIKMKYDQVCLPPAHINFSSFFTHIQFFQFCHWGRWTRHRLFLRSFWAPLFFFRLQPFQTPHQLIYKPHRIQKYLSPYQPQSHILTNNRILSLLVYRPMDYLHPFDFTGRQVSWKFVILYQLVFDFEDPPSFSSLLA